MITTIKKICSVFILCSLLFSCDSKEKKEDDKLSSDSTKTEKSKDVESNGISEGGKKDFATGMKTTYDGLSFDEIYLLNENKEKVTKTEFKLESKVLFDVVGIKGYKSENGKVHVGISVDVADESGKIIINLGDLLADKAEGYNEKDASELTASLTVGKPMEVGKKYFVKARFWDKKGKGEIKSEVEITLVK